MTVGTLTAHDRRRYAIARGRERRAAELAPVLAEVGWRQARPVVAAVMTPIRVTGPRGVWCRRVGKRAGARLVAALSALPAPERLPLSLSQPSCSVLREARDWCPPTLSAGAGR